MKLAAFAFHKAATPLVGINSRSHMHIPGIGSSRPVDAHRILQILLPHLTSNKWFAAKTMNHPEIPDSS
ncbi:hypothetical protein GQV87_004608 [Salmonella enterica]|uniref:Uncharacterized protein n=1 Tax=Salmonella enterica subsp. enterica serovar Kentucky TaxID=192955 RepID=A0A637WJU3_SALET|nr:hypothetical protein [Salmonella enterica subsp. enterica serovar Kentucky]EDE1939504.1 hypothetical protein [Salmonella enterica]EDI4077846.1 hypothetical protein [Salmonella enterica subsp. enterica serovar Kentucky]EDY4891038.1 hypothetical protein [Salmonella enterica subsp. enterica serovar Kentucky]EEG7760072.1 hypothetical protein [Salmonella enterica subsp. enterica serovar Kentucky]